MPQELSERVDESFQHIIELIQHKGLADSELIVATNELIYNPNEPKDVQRAKYYALLRAIRETKVNCQLSSQSRGIEGGFQYDMALESWHSLFDALKVRIEGFPFYRLEHLIAAVRVSHYKYDLPYIPLKIK